MNDQPVRRVRDNDGWTVWELPDGRLHRNDGPAAISPLGTEIWCQYGHRHRTDGPAIVDGHHTSWSWWLHGHRVTEATTVTVTRVAAATGVHPDRVAALAITMLTAGDALEATLLAVLTPTTA